MIGESASSGPGPPRWTHDMTGQWVDLWLQGVLSFQCATPYGAGGLRVVLIDAGPEVCMESPKVTVRSDADGVYVVSCAGEFDQDTIGELGTICARLDSGAKLLVLDVKNVAFADSSFLNTLIRLRNTRPLVLEGPLPDQLSRLLTLTGALGLFEMRDDDAQAS